MLGLAQKAGRIASGEVAAESAIRSGEARLVIAASDASAASRKHLLDMAAYRKIPALIWGGKDELGQAIGKSERAGLVVTDEGFAGRIGSMIRQETEQKVDQGV